VVSIARNSSRNVEVFSRNVFQPKPSVRLKVFDHFACWVDDDDGVFFACPSKAPIPGVLRTCVEHSWSFVCCFGVLTSALPSGRGGNQKGGRRELKGEIDWEKSKIQ